MERENPEARVASLGVELGTRIAQREALQSVVAFCEGREV